MWHLHGLCIAHAKSEIEDKRRIWKKLVDLGLEQEVLNDVCEMRGSAEANDLNSWKSARYRGLEKRLSKVKAWLLGNCVAVVEC